MAKKSTSSWVERVYGCIRRLSEGAKKILVVVFVASVLLNVVLVAFFLFKGNTMKISFDTLNKVNIELSGKEVRYKVILDKMMDEQETASYFVDWLRGKDFYNIEDVSFVDSLAEMLPELSEENPIELQRKYSDILSKHKMIKKLRDNAFQNLPPFQFIGTRVKIGVPEFLVNRPPAFKVNVPFDSPYVGKKIKLYSPSSSNIFLTLQGKAAFQKTDAVDMQLNADQAVYLFSSISAKTIEGIAYVLPSSEELFDPASQ